MSDESIFPIKPLVTRNWLIAILAISFLLHLYHLTVPISDAQSWNQCSAATVIRNLAEGDFDPFHPRWDVQNRGSAGPRIEAEEAPIYHVIVATLVKITGLRIEIWARLISILFGTMAGLYFFLLARRKLDDVTSLIATTFFMFAPLTFYFFRTIMSDPAMIFGINASLYYFDKYIETETWKDLLLAAFFTCLAGLFKPFALHVGIPILIMALVKFKWRIFTRIELYVFGIIAVAPPILWLYWAAQIGSLGGVTEGNEAVVQATHLWGRWSQFVDPDWYFKMQWRLFDRMATPVVSVLMLSAIVIKTARKKTGFFFWWLIGVVFYICLLGRGNDAHNYYQLPAAAPFAAIAAIGLVGILGKLKTEKRKNALAGSLVLFFIVSFLYVLPHYHLDLSSEIAGQLAKENTKPGEKILVMDPGSTRKNQVIWAAHREGWHFQNLKPSHIPEYKELGAAAVVVVLEIVQIEKRQEILDYLKANSSLVAEKKGGFSERGENAYHEISVYRLK